MYHPQVSPDGKVDLGKKFPQWKAYVDFTWHILQFLKDLFYKIDCSLPLNTEAAELCLNDREAFDLKVEECVQESIAKMYENAPNSSLRFTPWNQDLHQPLLNRILQVECEGGVKQSVI